ncbi:2040_t:CDS:2 [Entrophospora sp. SA101]|nr:2040_t:CDS:2 [Entrophospora sp. SA101]CAJ0910032.1 12055_t:CDS:2 [Entrophospora sp. SA101]
MFFCGIYYDIQEPELAKALRTIFPKASKSEIHKYMKQLSDVEEVNIHRANQRRDKNSYCIFHFRDMEELYSLTPIGAARYLFKRGEEDVKPDFVEDKRFFNIH